MQTQYKKNESLTLCQGQGRGNCPFLPSCAVFITAAENKVQFFFAASSQCELFLSSYPHRAFSPNHCPSESWERTICSSCPGFFSVTFTWQTQKAGNGKRGRPNGRERCRKVPESIIAITKQFLKLCWHFHPSAWQIYNFWKPHFICAPKQRA